MAVKLRYNTSPARKLPTQSPTPSPHNRGADVHKKNDSIKQVKEKLKIFSVRLGLDMMFLFLVIILVIIGLIMMFSASYPSALQYIGSSYYYLIRQGIFAAVGIAIMILLSYFDYHHLKKFAPILLIISYIMLFAVFLFPSEEGVHRWIRLGLFDIQASEISKLAIILFLAHWGSMHFRKMDTFKYGVLPPLIILVTTAFMLYKEPHYSGIVIVVALTAIMMFISGVKIRYFVIAGILLVGVIVVLVLTDNLGYAMERLDGWGQALNATDRDMWNKTYQTRNSLYAIGSGGLWGLGLGQSRQKYLYLPAAQNDFVFAVICEELGFVGAVIILLIFALLVWRGIHLSVNAKDKFGALLGIGLSAQIGLQVVLNIMVITDWMPNTGISLPFFSYGGSSLIMLLAQMGIILSISRTSNIEKV